MKVKSINLPENYSSISSSTTHGYVLLKVDEKDSVAQTAFVDKEFNILNKIKFDNYKRHQYKLVVNPNDTGRVGYLYLENNLIFFNINGVEVKRFEDKCVAAGFDSLNRLYIAERIDSDNLEIFVYDRDYNIITSSKIEDPIYESYVNFEYYPRINTMFLSLAGGQDGSCSYIVNIIDNRIILKDFLEGTAFVETDKNNEHFLCIDPYESTANYYTYPDLKLISTFDYYDYFEDGDITYIIVYLTDQLYLVAFDGRIYIYDASKTEIIEEIIIERHEAQPINVFYPNLKEGGIMTDIVSAQRFNDIIGFTTIGNKGFFIKVDDIIKQLEVK